MLAAIEQHRPALIYIAYPNNPTANLFDEGIVERVVAAVGRAARPGGVRRGLPALRFAHLVTQARHSTSMCW